MQNIRFRPGFAIAAALATVTAAGSAQAFELGSARAEASRTDTGRQAAAESRRSVRICARVEEGVGTRIRSMVCKTRAEWLRTDGFVPGEE